MNNIIGSWQLIEAESSLDLGKNIEMKFSEDGKLLYAIDAGSKWQIMKLVYKVVDDEIITDQPSHPNEQTTKFEFENDNLLILNYNGATARFKRIAKCSFSV